MNEYGDYRGIAPMDMSEDSAENYKFFKGSLIIT